MLRLPPRLYTVDVEFLKTKGKHFARSVAVVWMSSEEVGEEVPIAGGGVEEAGSSPSQGVDGTRKPPVRRTVFDISKSVLHTLRSDTVMAEAEALPAGHVLLPLLQAHTVRGEVLSQMMTRHRDAARKAHQAACLAEEEKQAPAPSPPPSGALFPNSARSSSGEPSPQQERFKKKRRKVKLPALLPSQFETFDAHTFPNPSAFDPSVWPAIFDDSPTSSTYQSAAQRLSVLLAYGKGRGRYRSLALLTQALPHFAQDVLHASFPTSTVWREFLWHCRQASLEAVERSNALYTGGSALLSPDPTAPAGGLLPAHTHDNLMSLSRALNTSWAAMLHPADQSTKTQQQQGVRREEAKFYSYGHADDAVIKQTLSVGCGNKSQSSSQGGAAATPPAAAAPSEHKTSWADLCPIQLFPTDQLLSPLQARVWDITGHSLFASAGFLPPSRLKPNLLEALQRTSLMGDPTATALLDNPRPHDPVWDAMALGCVCVACGVTCC